MKTIQLVLVLCVACWLAHDSISCCLADDVVQAIDLGDDAATKEALQHALTSADDRVTSNSDSANAYIDRGMARFAVGFVELSLEDFDKAIQLDSESAPSLWQRGISLYYVGRFADAAEQFRIHHEVNPDDVENTAWYFLCLAKSEGIDKAKSKIIPSRGDSRPKMMDVLKLYSGTLTAEDFEKSISQQSGLGAFFSNLYLGLFFEANNQSDKATERMKFAAASDHGGYMLRVAKVDLQRRTKKP
jgi:lipoprotein NlpI